MTRERYAEMLRGLDDKVVALGDLVADTIGEAVAALGAVDATMAQALIDADNTIDEQRYDIEEQALLLIATQQPLAGDLRTVASTLIIVTELERIGDYCEGIAKLTLRMAAEPMDGPLDDLRSMAEITERLLRAVMRAFQQRDVAAAGVVWQEDSTVDALYEQVFRRLVLNMATDRSSVRLGTYLLWVAHNVERMADRVTNIAERVAFIVTGDVASFREHLRSQTIPD